MANCFLVFSSQPYTVGLCPIIPITEEVKGTLHRVFALCSAQLLPVILDKHTFPADPIAHTFQNFCPGALWLSPVFTFSVLPFYPYLLGDSKHCTLLISPEMKEQISAAGSALPTYLIRQEAERWEPRVSSPGSLLRACRWAVFLILCLSGYNWDRAFHRLYVQVAFSPAGRVVRKGQGREVEVLT